MTQMQIQNEQPHRFNALNLFLAKVHDQKSSNETASYAQVGSTFNFSFTLFGNVQ